MPGARNVAPGTRVSLNRGALPEWSVPLLWGWAAANTQARPPFLASQGNHARFSGKTIILTPADAIWQVISTQG